MLVLRNHVHLDAEEFLLFKVEPPFVRKIKPASKLRLYCEPGRVVNATHWEAEEEKFQV